MDRKTIGLAMTVAALVVSTVAIVLAIMAFNRSTSSTSEPARTAITAQQPVPSTTTAPVATPSTVPPTTKPAIPAGPMLLHPVRTVAADLSVHVTNNKPVLTYGCNNPNDYAYVEVNSASDPFHGAKVVMTEENPSNTDSDTQTYAIVKFTGDTSFLQAHARSLIVETYILDSKKTDPNNKVVALNTDNIRHGVLLKKSDFNRTGLIAFVSVCTD
jgi:hypothetical protein